MAAPVVQLMRRACGGLLPAASRAARSQRQLAVGAAEIAPGEVSKTMRRELWGVYVMGAISLGFILHDFFYPEEEFEGIIPPYSYMRIRTKDFPWGTDMGPFERRRCVGEKPE